MLTIMIRQNIPTKILIQNIVISLSFNSSNGWITNITIFIFGNWSIIISTVSNVNVYRVIREITISSISTLVSFLEWPCWYTPRGSLL